MLVDIKGRHLEFSGGGNSLSHGSGDVPHLIAPMITITQKTAIDYDWRYDYPMSGACRIIFLSLSCLSIFSDPSIP